MSISSLHPERTTSTDTREDDAVGESETCPECGGTLEHDEERGETVCIECGLVVEAAEIDHGPEWRAFDDKEKDQKSRVGAPRTMLRHDEGLSSEIGWENEDAYGNKLDPKQRKKMERLRTWDERFRTKDSQERNLKQALGEIQRMGSALGLPEHVRETASVIYRRALDEDLLPGRSIEGVATAALYAGARDADTPRSLDEMEHVSRIEKIEIERTYRYVARQLDLGVEPADPPDYLPRFVSDLGASDELERTAHELLQTATEAGVHVGKNPVGVAAAAIYAAGRLRDEKLTQEAVSEVSDISQVTIRNRYTELLEAANAD